MAALSNFGLRALVAAGGVAAVAMMAMPTAKADEGKVTVFAAASMKNALDAVNQACATEVGEEAAISYASSSALAKQIESGAPADVFISADLDWMKYLHDKNLVKADTEKQLLGNAIVLVAPADTAKDVTLDKGFDLAGLIGDGRLAMGDPAHVPAGLYGKAALEKLGVWSKVQGRVAAADNVRNALLLVARGEAPYGIVYKTDANAEKRVRIAGTFPADSHAPIIYPVAVTKQANRAEADPFFKFLQSPAALATFQRYGFSRP